MRRPTRFLESLESLEQASRAAEGCAAQQRPRDHSSDRIFDGHRARAAHLPVEESSVEPTRAPVIVSNVERDKREALRARWRAAIAVLPSRNTVPCQEQAPLIADELPKTSPPALGLLTADLRRGSRAPVNR